MRSGVRETAQTGGKQQLHDPFAGLRGAGTHHVPEFRNNFVDLRLPAHPSMFARFADSFVGHGEPV